jgi:hypothetical protein
MIDTVLQQARIMGFFSLARPASYVPDIVSGVAQFCLERIAVTDGIIISWDIATTGMMSDINVAYSFLADRSRNGFVSDARVPTLNVGDKPIHILPGNHDKYWNTKARPNCKHFELKVADYMKHLQCGVDHWVHRKREQYLGFVSADFALQSSMDAMDTVYGKCGQGRVYGHVLEELKNRALMLRTRYSAIRVIWVVHFAPFDCGYALQLIDFHDIVRAVCRVRGMYRCCAQ